MICEKCGHCRKLMKVDSYDTAGTVRKGNPWRVICGAYRRPCVKEAPRGDCPDFMKKGWFK